MSQRDEQQTHCQRAGRSDKPRVLRQSTHPSPSFYQKGKYCRNKFLLMKINIVTDIRCCSSQHSTTFSLLFLVQNLTFVGFYILPWIVSFVLNLLYWEHTLMHSVGIIYIRNIQYSFLAFWTSNRRLVHYKFHVYSHFSHTVHDFISYVAVL